MYCSNCGSQMTGSTCNVCGATPSTTGVADSQTGLMLAGWWRRVGATFADNLILLLPTYLAFIIFGSFGVLIGFVASSAVQGVYLVKLLASSRGQTIGNRVAATRVRDQASGQAISTQQALKRWAFVAAYQAVIVLVAGRYTIDVLFLVSAADDLFPLYDSHKRTLHDRFAGTIVVMA